MIEARLVAPEDLLEEFHESDSDYETNEFEAEVSQVRTKKQRMHE